MWRPTPTARGTILVMNIYNIDYILAEYDKHNYPKKILDKERQIGRTHWENLWKALLAVVKIGFGIDAGVYPHGFDARQFARMAAFGMNHIQAIRTATSTAAYLMGWTGKLNEVITVAFTDLVASADDPLGVVRGLQRPNFVMNRGATVIKEP